MENDYEVEEVPISKGLETLKSLTNDTIRTIPQVTIDGEYIGGFAEVEAKIKGINIIKKHMKTTKEKKGGIISKENFIHISNLKNLDSTKKEESKTKANK